LPEFQGKFTVKYMKETPLLKINSFLLNKNNVTAGELGGAFRRFHALHYRDIDDLSSAGVAGLR
jgi:predicted DNA-binding transcriptional regulator YafY